MKQSVTVIAAMLGLVSGVCGDDARERQEVEARVAAAAKLPREQRIDSLGFALRRLSLPSVFKDRGKIQELYEEVREQLVSIPGYADYLGNKVRDHEARLQAGAGDWNTYERDRAAALASLKLSQSPDAVRVLVSFLDDNPGGPDARLPKQPKDSDTQFTPTSELVLRTLGEMGFENAVTNSRIHVNYVEGGVEKSKMIECIKMDVDRSKWKHWWSEVSAGKVTYRFKGSDVEYGPDGRVEVRKDTRPTWLPVVPAVIKDARDYTAADVLGLITTSPSALPAGHPYAAEGKAYDTLKAEWPGAATATNVDAWMDTMLATPMAVIPFHTPQDQEDLNSILDFRGLRGDIQWLLREVVTVDATAKADALIRVVNAQTDPAKRKCAAAFVGSLFEDLLDPRLLAYWKEELGDATVVSVRRTEGAPSTTYTTRGNSKSGLIHLLREKLHMTLDTAPFEVADEAAACAALSAWLDAHPTEIAAACSALKADPKRELPNLTRRTWK